MLGVDGLECFLLAGRGRRRAAGVGRIDVGEAVRVGLGLTQDGPRFVFEDSVVEAHLGEDGRHAVGALGVGDPPSAPAHDLQGRAGEVRAAADELCLAMHELEMVAPATAGTVHGAGALERAPQVASPLGRSARGAGEPQLFLRLYRPVTRRAHRIAPTAEAVGFYGREFRFHTELRAPQANYGAGDRCTGSTQS